MRPWIYRHAVWLFIPLFVACGMASDDPALLYSLSPSLTGEQIFSQTCVSCHGNSIYSYNKSQILSQVQSGAMPQGYTLTSTQRTNLLSYLSGL